MTDGNPRSDQETTPPTPTGWSQGSVEDDDALPPPFVPGNAAPGAGEAPPAAPQGPAGPPGREEGASEPFPFWSEPAEGSGGAGTEEDDFPFDAFDIEGGAEPLAAEASERGGSTGVAPGAAHELADRLEAMARRLRAEGPVAAESEMSSPDRLTALLAGLLAGYLAGRE